MDSRDEFARRSVGSSTLTTFIVRERTPFTVCRIVIDAATAWRASAPLRSREKSFQSTDTTVQVFREYKDVVKSTPCSCSFISHGVPFSLLFPSFAPLP